MGCEFADARDFPLGVIQDLAPYDWILFGDRFVFFIEERSPRGAAFVDALRGALAPGCRLVAAADYDGVLARAAQADCRGEFVDGGYRIGAAPAPDGFFAQWLGKPLELRAGDVVAAVDGEPLDATTLERIGGKLKHAGRFELDLLREGRPVKLRVALARAPLSVDHLMARVAHELPAEARAISYSGLPLIRGEWMRELPDVPVLHGWRAAFAGKAAKRVHLQGREFPGGGEVIVLGINCMSAAARADLVRKLADPAPFRWVFLVSNFVVAVSADAKAAAKPEVKSLVVGLRECFEAMGGEVVTREQWSSWHTR
jgi:hypothetical protein